MAAQPKKKISRVRGRTRRAHSAVKMVSLSACKHCGHPKPAHLVCNECGFYGGRKVLTTKTDKRISKKLQSDKKAELAKIKKEATKKPAKPKAPSKPKAQKAKPKTDKPSSKSDSKNS
ncbi:50S ribosomal protein L32 [Patescibacteria group bacterium]|nr:50S ribosomal protein L32 [Patescibacteria group bacterium]